MTIPQAGLPGLCYIHPAVLLGMASTHSLIYAHPASRSKETMFGEINLRIAEVRRRIEMMDMEDDEIDGLVRKVIRESVRYNAL